MEYKTIEGVAGRFFRCSGLNATLSDAACSKNYRWAMSEYGQREGFRPQCRGCDIGALHSGISPIQMSRSRFLGRLYCTRCQNPARRLIRKTICVSCYNREREVTVGKNAKGGIPIHAKPFAPATLACYVGDQLETKVRRLDRVTSRVEAVLAVLRMEPKPVTFGWLGPPILQEAA